MIAQHAAAFLDLLRADPNLTVFDGAPPDLTSPPYVVVWVAVDSERSDRLTFESSLATVRFTTHSVATTGQGARIVADRVRQAVLDARLDVPGWQTWPVRHEYGLPPQLDESTGHPLISVIDGWTLATTPKGGS